MRKRTVIPRSEWQFAHTVDGKLTPSDRHIHLNGGFQPGKIYEYVYVVADPVVAGGGFAAIRDFASYAKHASRCHNACGARLWRRHLAEWPIPARFPVSGLQRRRRRPNRARRRSGSRCRSRPRQLQLSLRPAFARCAAHFVRYFSRPIFSRLPISRKPIR